MRRIGLLGIWVAAAALVAAPATAAAELDLAPFARRCCVADQHHLQTTFDYEAARRAGLGAEKAADGRFIYGLQWAEERDIKEVRVRFRDVASDPQASVEYWFLNWPYSPPHMPTIEDPVDDPWQGQWLKAVAKVSCQGGECRYTFLPLAEAENPRAKNLPGVDYRRTLKLRLVFSADPHVEQVQIFSGSREKPVEVRVELGAGESAAHLWRGHIVVYNGQVRGAQLWNGSAGDSVRNAHFRVSTTGKPKGLLLGLIAAEPSLPGSHDVTIVTLDAGERTFSFAVPDVEKGPAYIPAFHAYVTLASDPHSFSPTIVKKDEGIREKLAREPEQTYERASREIPALDPVERQGGRLYLPLAADASWQKFAFEWGGNVSISKGGTKAKGRELERLEWNGDRVAWRIGTGEIPDFRPASKDSKLSVLEDHLPIATAAWSTDGIGYTEEAFATLLSGPLSPDDPARSEQTPAVLMLKLTVHNPASQAAVAHVWLATDPDEEVAFENEELLAAGGQLVRARVRLPESARVALAAVRDGTKTWRGIHVEIPLGRQEERAVFISLPFIPRLSPAERMRLAELNYEAERSRVETYWREVAERAVPFDVPERRFVTFAKGLVSRIRISATKDPKSGLYMVPAASYHYLVYANEAAFQCLLLDALGQHQLAAQYLETFVRLQGSKPFDGTYTGDQRAVYHGVRVDEVYDYTAHQYNLDHGTVLWALAEHYFFTRDKVWLERVLPSMRRAADWIIEQRRLTQIPDAGEQIPEYGLLPAGHLEDNADWGHWFSVNAFAAAGMTRLAQALADIGAPEAKHYSEEANTYARDLRDAVLRAAQLAPVIRLRDNTYVPYVPTRPYQRIRLFGPIRVAYYSRYPEKVLPTYRLSATREVLYGPMILLTTGIFRADEPLADWVLDDWEDNATMSTSLGLHVHGWVDDEYWFSRGGMVFQPNLQNPVLAYLRRHEIPAAIRNLYNDFVSCYYPDVNVFTEEYRQWRAPSGPFYKVPDEAKFVNRLRDALVREDGGTLWLAAGVPRRWLASGQKIELRDAPTYFGPTSYRIEANESGVDARVELPSRNPFRTAWLVLRAPEGKKIRAVEIDGKPWQDFDAAGERVRLPLKPGPMQVRVTF
ncbi:MAG: hypothetical protein ABSA70_13565 [Terriglobia bacterium]